jgi:hypothetical protein
MAFVENTDIEDDFRKVGTDATAGFERPRAKSQPTEHASSENLGVAGKTAPTDDDVEDDDDLEDDDELADDEDDLDDEDLDEDDDEEELDEDDDLEDDEDDDTEDEDDDDDDEDDLEDDDDAVKARLKGAETTARRR